MPKQEFGLQVGNSRFKLFELVSTVNGVYMVFPIPELRMHLSLHYPNNRYPNFAAFLRVPGINTSYSLDLNEEFFTRENVLTMVNSFTNYFENNSEFCEDDSNILIFPQSFLNGFSDEGNRNYFDMSHLNPFNLQVVQANKLAKIVTREAPTVVGVNLEQKNTAIIYDRNVGALQFSLENFQQIFHFDLFGGSLQRSFSIALDDIRDKRPDLLEKMTPTQLIEEWKKLILSAGAAPRRF